MSDFFATHQFIITVPAGKRLIAKAVVSLKSVNMALENGIVAVIAGTTNAYIAEELLLLTGEANSFPIYKFFRGITTAPGKKVSPDSGGFHSGDVIFEKGKWVREKTIFDAAAHMGKGDVVIKGANAVDALRKTAGIHIGNPSLGTSGEALKAAVGKKAELIIPVGLEKRVFGDITEIAKRLNSSSCFGPGMLPITGTIITELEAIEILTGAKAELVSAGGILGGEGCCRIAVTGSEDRLKVAKEIIGSISCEPHFEG
ncbi:MAG: hypothetical protein BWY15_02119 [Firmicutes bacterium ADurb.Bin193]|nr:MAG: hypothetical protein BWY15_02119 [Firmicutes bacterium ADurb.Bin193]